MTLGSGGMTFGSVGMTLGVVGRTEGDLVGAEPEMIPLELELYGPVEASNIGSRITGWVCDDEVLVSELENDET